MDPATITIILEVVNKSLQIYKEAKTKGQIDSLTINMGSALTKLNEIQSSLDLVLQKSDQLILRELRAAFEAINDAIATTNPQTRSIRLDFAENNLLNNTNLNSKLSTGEFKNSHLMALAHYGLAFVCLLRNDSEIAANHFLRTYEKDPRVARKELVPDIYEVILKPKCLEVYEWHQKQTDVLDTVERFVVFCNSLEDKNFDSEISGFIKETEKSMMDVTFFSRRISPITSQLSHLRNKMNSRLEEKLDVSCIKIIADMLAD